MDINSKLGQIQVKAAKRKALLKVCIIMTWLFFILSLLTWSSCTEQQINEFLSGNISTTTGQVTADGGSLLSRKKVCYSVSGKEYKVNAVYNLPEGYTVTVTYDEDDPSLAIYDELIVQGKKSAKMYRTCMFILTGLALLAFISVKKAEKEASDAMRAHIMNEYNIK